MRSVVPGMLFSVLALSTSCAQQICEKEFACQDELATSLDDDYVDVCVARRDGSDKVLRANAEPECGELANAVAALDACDAALSCEDLAASRGEPGSDDDKCKELRTAVAEALTAVDNGAACDGISDEEPAEPSPAE